MDACQCLCCLHFQLSGWGSSHAVVIVSLLIWRTVHAVVIVSILVRGETTALIVSCNSSLDSRGISFRSLGVLVLLVTSASSRGSGMGLQMCLLGHTTHHGMTGYMMELPSPAHGAHDDWIYDGSLQTEKVISDVSLWISAFLPSSLTLSQNPPGRRGSPHQSHFP